MRPGQFEELDEINLGTADGRGKRVRSGKLAALRMMRRRKDIPLWKRQLRMHRKPRATT